MNQPTSRADNRTPPIRNAARKLLPSLFEDILLPYGAYRLLKYLGVSEPIALAVGGGLSFARVLYGIARSRKLDLTALLMLLMFALTIITSLVSGEGRLGIATDSLYTGLAGIVLLGSWIRGQPLFYLLMRRQLANGAQAEPPGLRPRMTRVTAVWGSVLLAEALLRIGLLYVLPVKIMHWGSSVLMGATVIGLFLWTRRYNRKAQQLASPVDA